MCNLDQIQIASKKFDSKYQVQKGVDCGKIRISEGVIVNMHDTKYTIGCEVEPGEVFPLYVKTPKDCLVERVSRYSEASPWKMGFNVGEYEAWIRKYKVGRRLKSFRTKS